jgi:agmatine deiminase
VTFHHVPLDDIWFRDNGPIFVKNKNQIKCTKWEFNSWGQKFHWQKDNQVAYSVMEFLKIPYTKTDIVMEGGSLDVNGEGVALTTRQCLLSPMRNPNMSQEDIEKSLKDHLGIKKLLWLEDGLEGDHTDGHIDTIVRFVNKNTIVCSLTDDASDQNYDTMNENYEKLKNFTDTGGNHFHIIPLVLPKNRMEFDGERLPCTYANFYIGNGFVVVPQYGDPNDQIALKTLADIFLDKQVIGLKSKYLIHGGGSFHCVTQQQPSGEF